MMHVFYAGTVVLLAIALLSQFFHYIPKTALSAIIITAVLPMVDIRIVYKIFRIRGAYMVNTWDCAQHTSLDFQ